MKLSLTSAALSLLDPFACLEIETLHITELNILATQYFTPSRM